MFWFNQKPFTETFFVNLNELQQKVVVYHEKRNNSRVSIGKKAINIRLPLALDDAQKHQQIKKFLTWAEEKLEKRAIANPLAKSIYFDGRVLNLYDRKVQVKLELLEDKENAKASLKENMLNFKIPSVFSERERDQICSNFTVKLLRKAYQQKIEKKLHYFNDTFGFGTINQIRLKNNSTNWGSCSSKRNINISLRLLLAPEDVVNYVIIHELAHLKQANHSRKFWQLVEKAVPDYKRKEKWLKENSHLCIL